MGEFALGQPVPRFEDPRLLRGGGRYIDDLSLPRMVYGHVLRSPHAHARIRSIDTSAAKQVPGVLAVLTGADWQNSGWNDLPTPSGLRNRDGAAAYRPRFPALVTDRVRWVGDYVAFVVAETRFQAMDALELIEVEYEVLPHVIDVEAAMVPDAPVLHDDLFTQGVEPKPSAPSNVAKMITFTKGDTAKGFAEADVIIERKYTTKPVHQAYIEPQGCVARCDADGQAELWSSSQGHFVVRAYAAQLLGMKLGDLRVYPAEIGARSAARPWSMSSRWP